ncbi:hypothetical protein Tco_0384492, partial [Tanacetum coccineum]
IVQQGNSPKRLGKDAKGNTIVHPPVSLDDTILGGFHEETHAGPDDAPTTTADAAGRAEDPACKD